MGLCHLNDAVLYEDEYLQVGVQAEYSNADGHLTVYFGNKSSVTLESFTVQYYLAGQSRALRLTSSPIMQQLETGVQVAQRVGVTFMEPFVEPPSMRVQFLLPDASPRRIQVRLPVIVTKFMVGRDLNASEFFRAWRQQNFVLNEMTTIVHLAAHLHGRLTDVARTLVFGGALRLHRDIDENPDNFVLVGQLIEPSQSTQNSRNGFGNMPPSYGDEAGNWRLASDYPGSALSLARVEVGSGRFAGKVRVIVRSDSSQLAQALCEVIAMQLGEAGVPHSGSGNAR